MKKGVRVIMTLVCVSVLGLLFATGARASDWDKRTYVSVVGAQVVVPGTVNRSHFTMLNESNFVLRLLPSQSNRTIVLVYDATETRHLATVMAIPAYRLEPTDNALLIFRPTASGRLVLRKWFFAGDTAGLEFPGGLGAFEDQEIIGKEEPYIPGEKEPDGKVIENPEEVPPPAAPQDPNVLPPPPQLPVTPIKTYE